ncbi:glycosyltransferase [Alkalicoccobacillus porphyridii]|uniref:Glycosyltransferase n=1 Tax=Alkalicoccobacillus porphyridii TaxID=2597270 RepID=A0A554A3V7_9BACI|nr:glycosyltransferase [Alkalicoccobacillus porphyridii]TSB48377.1 glycosyltransferase [Alkalicoccobacillus porphyridii]
MNIKKKLHVLKRRTKFIVSPIVEYILKDRSKIRSIYTKYTERLPINDKTIMYEAYHGKNMTGNIYAIFLEAINDNRLKGFKHVWVINDKNNPHYDEISSMGNVEFVSVDDKNYLKYLATAKYLLNDTSFPYYFYKREGQYYVNTWHGTPLKTLGIDINNRSMSGHMNIQRNLLHVDLLVSPNEFTYKKLLKSHDVYELFPGKVADFGYPRVDLTLNTDKAIVLQDLNIDLQKKVVLYAPTWRGEVGKEYDTSLSLLEDVKAIQTSLGDNHVVLLKAHYFTTNFFKEQGLDHLCVPDSYDTNKLLAAVDMLITDYSSIFFDYLPTKKPIYFYMEDLNSYQNSRGLYFEIDSLPGPVSFNREELIHSLKNNNSKYIDNYEKFLDRFCYNDKGTQAKKLVETIFHGKHLEELIKTETEKERMLFYCGGFYNNGITVSAINLMDNIDYSKYEVAIIDNSNNHRDKFPNIKRLNPNVHILFRPGVFNRTIKETYWHELVMRRGVNSQFMKDKLPVRAYKRELRRLIGDATFNYGIDFGGYNKFWSLLFAFGDFNRNSIYLHNDMMEEYKKKVNGKFKHKHNLKVIFSLYDFYDKIVSVAKSTNETNKISLKTYIKSEDKMVYVNNVINAKKILEIKDNKNFINYAGKTFLITDDSQLNEKNILNLYGVNVPSDEYINFISIGRFSPEKGQEKLLNAFSDVISVYPKSRLYLVGDGPLKELLKSRIEQLNLTDHVILTGQLSNPYGLLSLCDCFVLSSEYEGQGLVLMEAMVLDKPVIGTNVTGVRSVLEGGYGHLVGNSVEELSIGMLSFVKNGLNRKKFDYDKYNKEALEMFYKHICARN